MKITHEICIAAPTDPAKCTELANQLMDALGHGPGMKLRAEHPEDTVHGRVSIQWCEAHSLGVDVLEFLDGHRETASAENVGPWFEEQGHRLMKIEGDQAYGNTIVHVQYTEENEAPTRFRKTSLARAEAFPTAEEVRSRVEGFAAKR